MADGETRIGVESSSVYVETKVKTNIVDNYLSIVMPKTLSADHTAVGLKGIEKAHEALVFGDVCYFNSDGEMAKADADAYATAGGGLAMAIASIDANADGLFLFNGKARDDSFAWTPGAFLYLSTTPGALDATAPSATDDVIKPIAQAAGNADTIIFYGTPGGVEHT
jgi:hypothetical protein